LIGWGGKKDTNRGGKEERSGKFLTAKRAGLRGFRGGGAENKKKKGETS